MLGSRMIRLRTVILAALAGAAVSWGVPEAAANDRALWVVEYENDIFSGQDRYYTSGVRFSRISEAREIPAWLEAAARGLPGFSEADTLPYGFSVGHNIYTPADITKPEFPPDDRPYAAWLHVTFSTGVQQEHGADRFRVGLGVVGPAALGEPVQKNIHGLVGADKPRGWNTQLRNEPTLLVGYDRFRRVIDRALSQGLGFDLSVLGGVTLGNAHTHLSTGTFFRVGRNMPYDYGPPRITPAVSGSGYFRPNGHQSWYFYAGAEGRLVARDLFIQGNTFGGRDGVDPRRLVGELYAGFVYTRDRFRVAYTQVRRSREFEGQLKGQNYGALSFSLWW